MKTYVHLWQYLTEFFLEWEKFQTLVEKIKPHIFGAITSSEKRVIYEIMWTKYGTTRQTTDGNIIRRIRFAFRMTESIDTHSEYSTLTAFPHQ